MQHKIAVWVIRAFQGPRHERLEKMWSDYERAHSDQIVLRVYDNLTKGLRHDECLENIWEIAKMQPEDRIIITEFDFIPYPSMCQWPFDSFTLVEPVQAAEYCTRCPITKRAKFHGIPGAWFVRISRPLLRRSAQIDFRAGGKFNDPAAQLGEKLASSSSQQVKLLRSEDCYPRHFGVRVVGAGEHLFWSRHYNDHRLGTRAGFKLCEIFEGVDRAISEATTKGN